MKTKTDVREDLIDMAWQAIDDRNDLDVSLRQLAEAAVDAIAAPETAAELDRVREINAELVEALTKIQEIIRQADWAETYSISDLNRAWIFIGEISAKAIARAETSHADDAGPDSHASEEDR